MSERFKGAIWLSTTGVLLGAIVGVAAYQSSGGAWWAWAAGAVGALAMGGTFFMGAWRSYDPPPVMAELSTDERRNRLRLFLVGATLFYGGVILVAAIPAFHGPLGVAVIVGALAIRIGISIVTGRRSR